MKGGIMKDKKVVVIILLFVSLALNIFCIGKIARIEDKLRMQAEEKDRLMEMMDFKISSAMKPVVENIDKINEEIGAINTNLQEESKNIKETFVKHEENITSQNKKNAEMFQELKDTVQKLEDMVKSQNVRITVLESIRQ